MGDSTTPDNSLSAPSHVTGPVHRYTHDTERIDHIISDEMLMQLVYGGKDISLQVSIGALGVAAGFFQNFASATAATWSGIAVDRWNGVGTVIFVIAATTCVIAAFSYCRNRINVEALVKRIQGRKTGVIDQPYAQGTPFPGDPTIPTDTSSTTE